MAIRLLLINSKSHISSIPDSWQNIIQLFDSKVQNVSCLYGVWATEVICFTETYAKTVETIHSLSQECNSSEKPIATSYCTSTVCTIQYSGLLVNRKLWQISGLCPLVVSVDKPKTKTPQPPLHLHHHEAVGIYTCSSIMACSRSQPQPTAAAAHHCALHRTTIPTSWPRSWWA